MEDLNYKELQIKAKVLGMEQVVGVSKEVLKNYISQKETNSDIEIEKQRNESMTDTELAINDEKANGQLENNDELELNVCNKNADQIAQTRGFRNYQHAVDYLKTDMFKNLSEPDQHELDEWFKSI